MAWYTLNIFEPGLYLTLKTSTFKDFVKITIKSMSRKIKQTKHKKKQKRILYYIEMCAWMCYYTCV